MLPAIRMQTLHVNQRYSKYIDASRMVSYPAASALLPPEFQPATSHLEFLRSILPRYACGNWSREYVNLWDVIARRRMAAIALAMKLYEADHGKMPTRLEELVPKYLPSLPLDPLAAEPRAFIYEPGGPHPRLRTSDKSAIFYLKGRPPASSQNASP